MAHTPDLDKIKQTLVKVKALADGGHEGEKKAAENLLKRLLSKYDINISEIEDEEVKERDFKHHRNPDARTIMCQVVYSVIDDNKAFLTKKSNMVHADTTYAQYIEIIEKYSYYWKLFCEQKELFIKAFVTRNELFSKKSVRLVEEGDENHEDAKKIAQMMFSMEKGDFQHKKGDTKQIEMK